MKKVSKYVRQRMLLKHQPRKVLNIEERLQVIRLYDRSPIYQRIATVFKCSWEQIKNVVANRDAIVQYYAHCQAIETSDNENQVRHKKINFLGNLMYEFITRAYYHRSTTLTDESLRERALEFRDVIGIEKFYPNRVWVKDFKHVYHVDLDHLDILVITQPPLMSLNSEDIVAHCKKKVQQALAVANKLPKDRLVSTRRETISAQLCETQPKYEEADELCLPNPNDEDINEDEEGPTIDYGKYDYHDDDEVDDDNDNVANAEDGKVQSKVANADKNRANANRQNITSYREACQHLRPLELFALNSEDFPAINLLAQLANLYEQGIRSKKQ